MPSLPNSIDIKDTTVTFDGYGWIPQTRLSSEQITFLDEKLREAKKYKLFANLKTFHQKRRSVEAIQSCWLLTTLDDKSIPLGFAYFQRFASRRSVRGYLYIKTDEHKISDLNHLYLIIGLAFKISKIDEMYLCIEGNESDKIGLSQTLTFKSIIIIQQNFSTSLTLQRHNLQVAQITSLDWNSCPAQQKIENRLRHISSRIERRQKKWLTKDKPKRPFIARLFSPKIDDSLF